MEDVGDVEHFRRHLDAGVDSGKLMMSVAIHAQMPFTRWQSTSPSLHGSGGPTIEDSPFHSSAGLMVLDVLKVTSVIFRVI